MSGRQVKAAVFILAKDEEANIARGLAELASSGWPVYILDSGSTDNTKEIVSLFSFAHFETYRYTNHCNAYNEITTTLGAGYEFKIVLDADMIVSKSLQREIALRMSEKKRRWQALDAKIDMCMKGVPLKYASLCPPKPFVFETEFAYFVSTGHGEKLIDGVTVNRLENRLLHDDRKSYGSFLQSQYRYSQNFVTRFREGKISGRDKLRFGGPLLIFAVPFVSYVLKRGFLDGRVGLIYALDRLIAEAIKYRQALASRVRQSVD